MWREERIANEHFKSMYRYPVRFTPDAPTRAFPRMGIVSEGLSELFAELIKSAHKDWLAAPIQGNPRMPSWRISNDARVWLFEEMDDWDVMSFNVCCQALGLEPTVFRNRLLNDGGVDFDLALTRRVRTAGRYHKVGREE